jgi:hypothetical protein
MLLHGNANGRLLPPVWKGGRSLQKTLPVGVWERVNSSLLAAIRKTLLSLAQSLSWLERFRVLMLTSIS